MRLNLKRIRDDWEKVSDLLLWADQALSFPISNGERNILLAIIVAEDHRFLKHFGVDPPSIVRALFRTLVLGKVEGASTIEQQLVRTILARFEYSVSRKITECILAIMVSRRFRKELIVRTYAYIAYYGWQANGLSQASRRLGITVDCATRRESATLAAMLKVPMPRAPSERYRLRIEQRISYILRRWEELDRRG